MDAPGNRMVPSQFNVQGYPTLKWFEPGSVGSSSGSEYNGGRTANEIVDWILDEVNKNAPPPEPKQVWFYTSDLI